jgi:hypothetical protein
MMIHKLAFVGYAYKSLVLLILALVVISN